MGLGSNILQEIIDLKRADALIDATRIVEIGSQQLSNDFLRADAQLKEVFELFGRPAVPRLGEPIAVGYLGGLELQSANAPPSQLFWEALGFHYATIDFDGHRHSYPLDLNKDSVPRHWRNNFDLAINAGTTEHLANQDNAFRVIHDLVRKGGIMIHELPAGGMPTHGLITYTMKFFWHLCRENRYQVLRLEMSPGGTAPLPDNIVATNAQFGRTHNAARFEGESIRDWMIFATLRKVNDDAYVTPLDLPPEVMPKVMHEAVSRGLRRIWHRLKPA